jgi:hypothetical protein
LPDDFLAEVVALGRGETVRKGRMHLYNEYVRDLVGRKGTNRLLIGRIMGPFLGSLDRSLALLDGIGQLAVEMRSVSKLVISCLFLRHGRASGRREIRSLRGRSEYR